MKWLNVSNKSGFLSCLSSYKFIAVCWFVDIQCLPPISYNVRRHQQILNKRGGGALCKGAEGVRRGMSPPSSYQNCLCNINKRGSKCYAVPIVLHHLTAWSANNTELIVLEIHCILTIVHHDEQCLLAEPLPTTGWFWKLKKRRQIQSKASEINWTMHTCSVYYNMEHQKGNWNWWLKPNWW